MRRHDLQRFLWEEVTIALHVRLFNRHDIVVCRYSRARTIVAYMKINYYG